MLWGNTHGSDEYGRLIGKAVFFYIFYLGVFNLAVPKKLEAGAPPPWVSGKGWDITKQDRPNLTQEFLDRFVVGEVKGDDDYIAVDGLVALAHERGPFEILDMVVISVPSKENGNYAAVKAIIKGVQYNKYAGNVECCTFSDIGDASPESVPNKYIRPHMLRMAGTRAIGRALRNYLNIPILTAEEMAAFEGPSATQDQMDRIRELYQTKVIDKNKYRDYLIENIGRPALKKRNGKRPTENEANIVINYLESKKDKEDNAD